jgi:phage shock protein PspC (stress-responsive transcriptional regulator)
MSSINKFEADVELVESVCGICLMLAGFAVAAYVVLSVATLSADAALVPFLELL